MIVNVGERSSLDDGYVRACGVLSSSWPVTLVFISENA